MKHRKLFFSISTSSSTTACLDPCDPSCYSSSDCYPFPPDPPDFLLPLPSPPPPPLSSTATVSPYVIVAISLLATLFLLVAYYILVVKRCSRSSLPDLQDNDDFDFPVFILGPEIEPGSDVNDHPIWHINTPGLQPSAINSIAVFKYKACRAQTQRSVCSVCLSEFQEGEPLRLLPKCKHAFHIPCIDTWLRSHTNCPLCRAGVSPNSPPNSSSNEDTVVLDNGLLGNSMDDNIEVVENAGGDTGIGICENTYEKIIETSASNEVRNTKGRRTLSMDSLTNAIFDNVFIDKTRDLGSSMVDKEIESSSSAKHASPSSMKRSFSCGGKLFSSSRYSNKSSNSSLPL